MTNLNDNEQGLRYGAIRTANMLPDRSTDVHFDPKIEPSLTMQQFKDECDVNRIVEMHQEIGLITHMNKAQPMYGDFTNIPDYQEAVAIVQQTDDAFMALPAKVRARFDNDPAQLLAFISDENNREEALELGIIQSPPKTEAIAVPAASAEEKPVDPAVV